MQTQEISTVKEAARTLGWTLKYVYDLIYSGRISAKKVAGRWQIPKTEIEIRLRKRGEQ